MVLISDIIYCIYVGFAAITFLFLLKHLFKRESGIGQRHRVCLLSHPVPPARSANQVRGEVK